MKACVMFPGQGFQKFGILSSLAARYPRIVVPILQDCDDVLPQLSLSRLLLGKGDPVDVTPTEIAQPLLLAHGIACYSIWQNLNSDTTVKYGMGHSLGEYTAFVASGLLPFRDALKLVRSRGEAMQKAALTANTVTGMVTIVKPSKIEPEKWHQLVNDATKVGGCDVAAFNSPSLIVLSGDKCSLDKTIEVIKSNEHIIKQKLRIITKTLPVSAAFHSRHMSLASTMLESLVSQQNWNRIDSSKFTVISNVTGLPYQSTDEVKSSCVAALTNPVKWWQSVIYADTQGVDEFVGIGGNINKMTEKNVSAASKIFE